MDETIWSSTTSIICFTMVEMPHHDRVKIQFKLHQNILDSTRYFKKSQKSSVPPVGIHTLDRLQHRRVSSMEEPPKLCHGR